MTRREKGIFYLLVVVGLALTAAFGVVWFLPQNIPHNFSGYGHVFDFLLFFTVSYVVWHQICTELLLWLISERIRRPLYVPPQSGLKVAFVTTFVPSSEPIELLKRILPALKRAEYEHDTWLLDEGNSKEAQAICKQLGVKYFTRHGLQHYNTNGGQFAARTKGGNHNAWYDAFGHNYDIVAQIDTDFVPRKDFLLRTLGYFKDPRVAFVGTPQIYGNFRRSFVARGTAEQQYTFYGPILQGLYGRNMMMLLGANHVIRVAALKHINYYGAHLTEDLLTGMTIHSKKWTSVYVPEVLAVGEGPETWTSYFNQQMRWAYGCIDILFKHSPKLLRRMDRERRRYYFMILQHYFSGVAMALGVATIFLYFCFGFTATTVGLTALLFYVPLLLWQALITAWLQRFNIMPKRERGLLFAGRIVSIAAWPIYFLAFIGVVRRKRLSFKVTPKGEGQQKHVPLKIFMPHLMIGTLTAIGFGVSFKTHYQSPIIIFWAVMTMLAMIGIPLWAWVDGMVRYRLATR